MKLIDLTGKEFPNLTVLYRGKDIIKDGKKRSIRWHCRCKCGNEFDVIAGNLTKRPGMTCNECAKKIRADKQRLDRSGEKYGILTILEIIPNTYPTKVKCKCDCGNSYIGIQADIVYGHTKSCGCLQKEIVLEINTKNWTGFVSDYGIEFLERDHMNDERQWLWKCKCGVCKSEFIALPAKVNNGHITSCGCAKMSAGERFIENTLNEFGYIFQRQYSFDDCKDKNILPFDFAILNKSEVLFLIEYDGKQHYEPIDWFGGVDKFNQQIKRDQIKNDYCKSHHIPLLRLPYTLSNKEIKQQIYEYHLSVETAGYI